MTTLDIEKERERRTMFLTIMLHNAPEDHPLHKAKNFSHISQSLLQTSIIKKLKKKYGAI